ncbi:hypothetical protein JW756_04065 [Candidatus Woesearchaeota archaeon]|nr:hypothetical protein [Candidatus Woesearchaeota archaeon]
MSGKPEKDDDEIQTGIEAILKPTPEEKYSEEGMIRESQRILGRALVNYFSGQLGNELLKPVNSGLGTYLSTLGPFTLQIYPSFTGTNAVQKIALLSDNSTELMKKIYAAIFGEYVLKTNLFSNQDSQVNLTSIMSEFYSASRYFQLDIRLSGISTHPLILAMSLRPENRALYALAVEHAMKKNNLKHCIDGSLFEQICQNIAPTKSILEVAEIYQIKNLKNLMNDINQVINNYGCWKK